MSTKKIDEKVASTLSNEIVKDKEKLQKQQEYYKNLTNKGVIRKQTYKLKPLSAI